MPRNFTLLRVAGVTTFCTSLLLTSCGGGDDTASASPTDAPPIAGTLLDDDGGVMPSDPRVVSTAMAPITGAQRYATSAQARDLQRSLRDGVGWIEVACCDDAAVMQAISAALAQDADRQPAVFVSGANASLGAVVVNRLLAAGLDRVWWVSP